jgi:hypothetical protein
MSAMRVVRTVHPLLRIALAVVFGFMSLAHGPVMGFAKANAGSQHHHMASGAYDHDRAVPLRANTTAVCYSFGCFIAVAPVAIAAPRAGLSLFAKLSPSLARPVLPVWPDQPDPPPRLQA